MNNENLIPFPERTEDERRRIAKMGGVASGKARREMKSLRAAAKVFVAENPDATMKIIMALFEECVGGNVKAIDKMQDLLGETVQHDRLKFDKQQAKDARAGKQSPELPKLLEALMEESENDVSETIKKTEAGV